MAATWLMNKSATLLFTSQGPMRSVCRSAQNHGRDDWPPDFHEVRDVTKYVFGLTKRLFCRFEFHPDKAWARALVGKNHFFCMRIAALQNEKKAAWAAYFGFAVIQPADRS